MAKKKKHKIPTCPKKYAKYCQRRDALIDGALIDGDQKKYTKGTQSHENKKKYKRNKKHKNS
jgi:hypothetical protein